MRCHPDRVLTEGDELTLLRERVARYEAAERARSLTMTEAAAKLGVHRTTLLAKVKRGDIPSTKVGNRHRIPGSWVADTLAAAIADMQARADLTTAEMQASA